MNSTVFAISIIPAGAVSNSNLIVKIENESGKSSELLSLIFHMPAQLGNYPPAESGAVEFSEMRG